MIIALVLCFLFFVAYLVLWYLDGRTLPPGPWGVPIFGYLPFFDRNLYVAVKKLRDNYGQLCSVKMGFKTAIFVNDYRLIRTLLEDGHKFAFRPLEMYTFHEHSNRKGIFVNEGDEWKLVHRLSMTILRNLGMGKQAMEHRVKQESFYLIEQLELQNGDPICLKNHLAKASCNIMCSTFLGHRFNYEDGQFSKLVDTILIMAETFSNGNVLNFLPFLKYVPPFTKIVAQDRKCVDVMVDLIRPAIAQHKQRLDETGGDYDSCDFIAAYLKEVHRYSQIGDDATMKVLESNLLLTVVQFFLAGTETTSTTLQWAVLMMVLNPHVQQKIQQQLDKVVGRNNMPKYEDRKKLPYIDACIKEIHRVAMISPTLPPHSNDQEQWLGGYRIPKRSLIFCAQSVSWEDPAYGGKRVCAGEALARMEVFLYLTSLLHTFTFEKVPGQEYRYPTLNERKPGFTCSPPDFKIIARRRHR